jgi:hypothetical protein
VLEGARETLTRHHPKLVIEVHGHVAARQVFPQLDTLGYTFEELDSGMKFESGRAILDWFPDQVLRVLCS